MNSSRIHCHRNLSRTRLLGLVLGILLIGSQFTGCALESGISKPLPQDNFKELLDQGYHEYDAGRYAEALRLFRQAQVIAGTTRDSSRSMTVYYVIGRTQLELDSYDEALQSFTRGLELATQGNFRR